MKHNILMLFAISICTNLHNTCMERQISPCGRVDDCMVILFMAEPNFQEEINQHQFSESTPLIFSFSCPKSLAFSKQPSPKVKYACLQLSSDVFYRISQKEMGKCIKISNPLNQHPNAIDKHTYWEPILDSEDVMLSTEFHEKKDLLAMIEKLEKSNNNVRL